MAATTDTVRHLIERSIQRGEYIPGSRLPGERELSTRLGVSRVTLRRALAQLEAEGRLERSAQRGWFVTSDTVGEAPSVLESFTEMARARGLRPTAKILHQQTRPCTLEESERLRIAPAAPVIELRRLRAMDGQPICVDLTVIRFDLAGALATADLADESLYERLETLCGVTLQRANYVVQAAGADAEIAKLLKLAPGSPILVGTEIDYSADGQPIMLGTNRYRGDAYRFSVELVRPA